MGKRVNNYIIKLRLHMWELKKNYPREEESMERKTQHKKGTRVSNSKEDSKEVLNRRL